MSPDTIARLIRGHILAALPPDKRDLELTDSSSLVATGILDSVDVFELVAFIEDRFGIEITDAELRWTTFETIDAITGLVESKLAARSGGAA